MPLAGTLANWIKRVQQAGQKDIAQASSQAELQSQQQCHDQQNWLARLPALCSTKSRQLDHQASAGGSRSLAVNQSICCNRSTAGSSGSNRGPCSRSSSNSGRTSKLTFKTSVDLNSRHCTAEVTWHARFEGQPAKLCFKWRDNHPATIIYDAQVALRRSSSHKLRFAGDPQALHSASLLLQQSSSAFGPDRSSSSVRGGGGNGSAGPTPDIETVRRIQGSGATQVLPGTATMSDAQATATSRRRAACRSEGTGGSSQHQQQTSSQQAVAAAATAAASSSRRTRTRSRRPTRMGPGKDAADEDMDGIGQDGSGASCNRSSSIGLDQDQPMLRASDGSGLQLELGWNFRAQAPILAASLRLEAAAITSSSSSDNSNNTGLSSGSGSSSNSKFIKQLKAAYEVKAHALILSAAGSGWSVGVTLPTQGKGLMGLVPSVGRAGCRPKVTLMVVPELQLD